MAGLGLLLGLLLLIGSSQVLQLLLRGRRRLLRIRHGLAGLLLASLRLLLGVLLRLALLLAALDRLRQILELGDDVHAALLVAGIGERAGTPNDLLDVAVAALRQLGLRDPLLDLVEPLHAFLLLLSGRRAGQHEAQPRAGQERRAQSSDPHVSPSNIDGMAPARRARLLHTERPPVANVPVPHPWRSRKRRRNDRTPTKRPAMERAG